MGWEQGSGPRGQPRLFLVPPASARLARTRGTDQGSDGDEVGPQQGLPESGCPSGQPMRQGPGLQPQEPARARSPEKGLAKGGAHSGPTALSPRRQRQDRAAARMGTLAAAGGSHGSQAGFVGVACVLASGQRGVSGQTVAVVSSHRALGQGLRSGVTYWCRKDRGGAGPPPLGGGRAGPGPGAPAWQGRRTQGGEAPCRGPGPSSGAVHPSVLPPQSLLLL